MSSYVCDKCGKECKDKRGLGIHYVKCDGIKSCECNYCKQPFANPYSLSVHLTRCKIVKKNKETIANDIVLKTQTKLIEYEDEIRHLRSLLEDREKAYRVDLDRQLKIRDSDLNLLIHEVNELSSTLKNKELENEVLIKELNEVKVEKRTLEEINNRLILKDTTTNNNTTIINQNDNRVQLQCLLPSMIQGRIAPPDYVIGTVNDFVNMLRSLGVRNCFRVNDKSRGTLSWNKPGEGEVRDPNGDQLLTHIIDSIDTDLMKEKCYYEEELKKLCEANEQDQYLIEESRAFVTFCSQLLRKDPNILKKIKKELIKQGKSKGNSEMDEISEVTYNKFCTSIMLALFPNMSEWINLSFFELGQMIGKKIKDHYHTEGASSVYLYIIIHSDNNYIKKIHSKSLMIYISEAISLGIESDMTKNIIEDLLLNYNNASNIEKMLNYLEEPNIEDTKEIMRGIVTV
jgi:Zinc finger, C2H2 type